MKLINRSSITLATALSSLLLVTGCDSKPETTEAPAAPVAEQEVAKEAPPAGKEAADDKRVALKRALHAQPEEVKARYVARNPAKTLEFFGVEPGMTVAEVGPGGGWYSNILAPYLGREGNLIGLGYEPSLYTHFNMSEERLAEVATWKDTWPETIGVDMRRTANVTAHNLTEISEDVDSSVDVVLFFRVLHSFVNLEQQEKGSYMTNALADAYRILKPGGTVGVVQHMGPESNSDEWAYGDYGYLKKSLVIERFEAAGFVLDAESDINLNPADVPSEDEHVWRLPPSSVEQEDPELAKKYLEIGESNRMTLRFVKPTAE